MRDLATATVDLLRPTQITVAMARVEQIRAQIRGALARGQLRDFLTWRPLTGVLGPSNAIYVIDEHHVARALSDEKIDTCLMVVRQDLSRVLPDRFWIAMERAGFVHPVDALGRRRAFANIPRHLAQLTDDPYRHLALAVRENGGSLNWSGDAAEIQWANFLRSCVPADLLTANPSEALTRALSHARGETARRLPGWKAAGS